MRAFKRKSSAAAAVVALLTYYGVDHDVGAMVQRLPVVEPQPFGEAFGGGVYFEAISRRPKQKKFEKRNRCIIQQNRAKNTTT